MLNVIEPKVYKLGESGLNVAEFAARTCYDSFDKEGSNEIVNRTHYEITHGLVDEDWEAFDESSCQVNDTDDHPLLDKLAWTYFHHSVLEHATISFYIEGTSRGVLQEMARHRIQAISVRSTRYTMGDILKVYLIVKYLTPCVDRTKDWVKFVGYFNHNNNNFLVIDDPDFRIIEYGNLYDKIDYIFTRTMEEDKSKILTKKDLLIFSGVTELATNTESIGIILKSLTGSKRNVGDGFKEVVTDNWKTNIVSTFNLRSLKNLYSLRDSGAAWRQIRTLARAMKAVTPVNYLKLIDKEYKDV